MQPGKTPTGCGHCSKMQTGSRDSSSAGAISLVLLLPCWLHVVFGHERDRAYFGNVTVRQLPALAVLFPNIDHKELSALGLAFIGGLLDAIKLNHRKIVLIRYRKLTQ